MVRFQIIPVTPFQQNCTVFWNEETMNGAVVDPAAIWLCWINLSTNRASKLKKFW